MLSVPSGQTGFTGDCRKLIGAECWYDVVDNGTTDLRQGRVRIRYKYTPVPPLEDMGFYQTFY